MMKSVLIANRGEIACRIMRTAKSRGLRSIAVYSEADRFAKHVKFADDAVCIGPALATKSYLSVDAILDAAKRTQADAIHPGYGFLSENAEFVDACTRQGIRFIGPSADSIRAMGQKDAAKRLMEEAGVPVVPGYHGDNQDPHFLRDRAADIGYPVLIKARSGGGGKGMRRVDKSEDFPAALEAAQREAQSSFGDAHVLVEKFVAKPRHIEVQVFGDSSGQVVHLFERDCSLQRRHQKVIEEAPAPGMTQSIRHAMTSAAVKAAEVINYEGAGTIEFIVDSSQGLREDGFWFMEMNTRLQVEHPVTEAITGIDLVDWQFRIADGEPLPLTQSQIMLNGHAVEARLYAEDPESGFLPATGTLEHWQLSELGRVDSGVDQGDEVLPHYDPLLAKLITHASTRDRAFSCLAQQLSSSAVLGTRTNREFLRRLVSQTEVMAGRFDTAFIADHINELVEPNYLAEIMAVAAVALVDPSAFLHVGIAESAEPLTSGTNGVAVALGAWQLWGEVQRSVTLIYKGSNIRFRLMQARSGESHPVWRVFSDDAVFFPSGGICIEPFPSGRIIIDGVDKRGLVLIKQQFIYVQTAEETGEFGRVTPGEQVAQSESSSVIVSAMPGRIVALNCQLGDQVKAGQALISMEAMKMEQELSCSRDGVVESIPVSVGDQVAQGAELVRLKEDNS